MLALLIGFGGTRYSARTGLLYTVIDPSGVRSCDREGIYLLGSSLVVRVPSCQLNALFIDLGVPSSHVCMVVPLSTKQLRAGSYRTRSRVSIVSFIAALRAIGLGAVVGIPALGLSSKAQGR